MFNKRIFLRTNQHSCNDKNCASDVKFKTYRTILHQNNRCELNDCDNDARFSMNEISGYYRMCKQRVINKGLFKADQVVEK